MINESFFLYDKSNLIKKTAINKQLSLYGSFSYFSGKTSIKNLKLIDVINSLKFLIKKKSLKDNLKLQIAYADGSDVKTEDQKIHDFSITKLRKRKKKMLSEPIETPIGLLFPASIKNDTTHIFITANNISGVKKSILTYKIYNILADIDLNKINNWSEIKGQSIWKNVNFKDK